jgi:hypothetical protein
MADMTLRIDARNLQSVKDHIEALRRELLERTIAHEDEVRRNQRLALALDVSHKIAVSAKSVSATVVDIIQDELCRSGAERLVDECADVISEAVIDALRDDD